MCSVQDTFLIRFYFLCNELSSKIKCVAGHLSGALKLLVVIAMSIL